MTVKRDDQSVITKRHGVAALYLLRLPAVQYGRLCLAHCMFSIGMPWWCCGLVLWCYVSGGPALLDSSDCVGCVMVDEALGSGLVRSDGSARHGLAHHPWLMVVRRILNGLCVCWLPLLTRDEAVCYKGTAVFCLGEWATGYSPHWVQHSHCGAPRCALATHPHPKV